MENARIQKLETLAQHPWLHRIYKRLGRADLEMVRSFCQQHRDLSAGDYEMRVNRLFMDREKPRRWKEILEILIHTA